MNSKTENIMEKPFMMRELSQVNIRWRNMYYLDAVSIVSYYLEDNDIPEYYRSDTFLNCGIQLMRMPDNTLDVEIWEL